MIASLRQLRHYAQFFGFLAGGRLWVDLHSGRTKRLHLPELKHPVAIRSGTIDWFTFDDVFVAEAYAIELPDGFGTPRFVIDGGANIGLSSVFFANRWPEATIVALEPEDENYEYLRVNTRSYGQITALRSAIWDSTASLEVRDLGHGLRGFTVHEVADAGPRTVEATSISRLMEEAGFDTVDVLKLDVEGSERQIFSRRFEEWLPHVRCLIVELHDRMVPGCSRAVFSALSQYDFSLEVRGENLVFFNNSLSPNHQD